MHLLEDKGAVIQRDGSLAGAEARNALFLTTVLDSCPNGLPLQPLVDQRDADRMDRRLSGRTRPQRDRMGVEADARLLARIMHKFSTAAGESPALTALRAWSTSSAYCTSTPGRGPRSQALSERVFSRFATKTL